MIKRWCVQVGLWLARLGGWQEPCAEVREVVKEIHYPPEIREVIVRETVSDEALIHQSQTAVLPVVPADIQDAAKLLIEDAHRRSPDRSGESKRAQVYWQLINAYPKVSKRVLSVAIEEAVCSVS